MLALQETPLRVELNDVIYHMNNALSKKNHEEIILRYRFVVVLNVGLRLDNAIYKERYSLEQILEIKDSISEHHSNQITPKVEI